MRFTVYHHMSKLQSHSKKHYLRRLFYGRISRPTVVSDLLLAANVFIILESIIGLFINVGIFMTYVEFAFGVLFALEYLLRFWISRHKLQFAFRMVNMLDIVVIGSLLLTIVTPNLAFLRVLRALQIFRAYKLLGKRFDHHNDFMHRNIEVVTALVNILVFLVITSTAVYLQQGPINDDVTSYIDALYFTIAAVTTTGFGDIVVVDTTGKILSIVIMIFGVTLFFRLVKSVFVPRKLYAVCDGCGKDSHELHAHFCSGCGRKIKSVLQYRPGHAHKDDF